jgi:arsenate reductase (thioredoxin)
MSQPTRVLFLCTGNSCRSQMAEAIFRGEADERWEALSAGTHPASEVHPVALETLRQLGYETEGLRPKGLCEFAGQRIDLLITTCSDADEECPFYPAKRRLHWPFPDPAAATGTEDEVRAAYLAVAQELVVRIRGLLAEPTIEED